MLRMQAIESKSPARTTGADHASGTHHPGHDIRGFCAARDRLRVEGDVAVVGWTARAVELGGQRFARARATGARTPGTAGRGGSALCAAQARPAAELRRAGVSSGGFSIVSCLCPAAAGMVAQKIGAP